MKKIKRCMALFLMATCFSPLLLNAKDVTHYTKEHLAASSSNKQMNQNQMNYDDSDNMTQDDCSMLTPAEQKFANMLNDRNAMSFCSKMTPAQRQKAMQMTTTKGSSGKKMTPDESVQKVMQDNPPSNAPRSSGGACPVN